MFGFSSALLAAAVTLTPPERPYEFDWANRTADEFAPVARLEDAAGWKATGAGAEVRLEDGAEFALFGKGTLRVRYRAAARNVSFTLSPERPIACPDGFDTLSVWLRIINLRGPALAFSAEFADARSRRFTLPLDKIRHDEWHCVVGVLPPELRQRGKKGAKFLGFTVSGATNEVFRTMDLTSLCIFRDPQRPLPKTERPKRGVQVFADQPQGHNTGAGRLPFPNRADTMMPPRKEVAGLEFRLPEEDATCWDKLAFRLDGGAWIPLAQDGGLYPRAMAKGAKVRFRREANSVVAEIEAEAGVQEVSFGAGAFPRGHELVPWPYMTLAWCDQYDIPGYRDGGIYRPKTAVFSVGGRTCCVGAMFDWTQSGASAPTDREDAAEGLQQLCCAVQYVPKTDGRRNRVYERFVWTVGESPEDVFPSLPNPESPWKHVAGTGVWRAHPASDDRQADYRFWRTVRAAGMENVIVTDHEKGWRDGNESFTFRTRPAPKKGGDKGQSDYARFMIDTLGFRYGPYNNFTDFPPVNGFWGLDRVGRSWNGALVTAWNRCYSPKSTWAVGMCERLAPEIQGKFGFNTAYCDVHTCVTPWLRCDYDARAPGAGTFAQVFYDYGEIMLLQKKAWNGPVYSEGGFHWWYCGLTDGNYAQDSTYGLATNPWLVDFDLRRLHDKCCNFGMGNPGMFYSGTKGESQFGHETWLMRFLAATIAFGHPGFLVCNPKASDFGLDDAQASYFLVQGIAAKYTQASARDIRYADAAGTLHPTAVALTNGAWRRSQVFVRYSDGTEVAVNGNADEPFSVTVRGRAYELPPNGWAAVSGDRRAGSLNVRWDGETMQCGWSEKYTFGRRGGKRVPMEEIPFAERFVDEAPRTVFGGFVGDRAKELLEGRVFSAFARVDAMDECVRAFETHEDDATVAGKRHSWWQGEYWGKTMLGHTGAWRYTGRDDVRDYVRRQVARLVSVHQRPDGYLGTYADERFVTRSWNLWGRKYTLWALVEAFEATGDRTALVAAEKSLDQMIAMLKDMKLSVRESGCFNGLPTASVLSPVVRLCRHVPKAAYRAFMDEIVADWDRADGAAPNLIANAFGGKPVHTWYPEPVIWAKGYEMMSCYEGLVDYAVMTGRARPLEAAERAADLLCEHEGNPLGAVGYYDHFTHAAANANATVELCDVIYWMRLCHALYRATGHVRHLDRAERAFCNAFLAGLYRGGRWGAYSVRSHGTRHGTAALQIGMRHHCCCVDNSPRGFYDMAEHAVLRRGQGVDVNHFLPCTAYLGGGLKVEIGGNYPVSEDVSLTVTAPTPTRFALRVPGWCARCSVDGTVQTPVDGRIVLTAKGTRRWAIRFEMPVTVVHRPDVGEPALLPGDECDGKGHDGRLFLFELAVRHPEMKGLGRTTNAATVMRGPLVLTKARRMGLTEGEIFDAATVNGAPGVVARTVPHPDTGVWGAWDLTLEQGGRRRTVTVCDLPSAAPSDDWQNAFSIWF